MFDAKKRFFVQRLVVSIRASRGKKEREGRSGSVLVYRDRGQIPVGRDE